MNTHNLSSRTIQPWHLATFVGGALLILLVSFLFLGSAKGWFVEHKPLRFYADSALQLRPGLPVRLAGIKVGQIKNISLDNNGKVLVNIIVERHYTSFLRQNTQATLAKETLMGDSFIDLSVGNQDTALLEDNAVITYIPATDINVVAKLMVDKLDQTMTDLQKLLTTLNDPKGKLNSSLTNLNTLLTDMHGTRAKLDQTLTTVSTTAERSDLKKTLDDANVMLKNANDTLQNMQTHWPFTPSSKLKEEREKENKSP